MYVKDIQAISMYTRTNSLNQLNNYFSVITNNRDIYANIAISTVAIGASITVDDGRIGGQMGFVGSLIRDYAYVDASGDLRFGNLTPDFMNNAVGVSKCAFITFALEVAFGEAYAQANIFYFSQLPVAQKKSLKFNPFTLVAYEKRTKKIVSHMQFLVEDKSEASILRTVIDRNSIATCKKLGIGRNDLKFSRIDKIGMKIYGGQAIDEIPSRLRKDFTVRQKLKK